MHFHIFVLVTVFLVPLLWSFCFDIVNTIYRSRDVVYMRFLVDVKIVDSIKDSIIALKILKLHNK